MQSLIGFENSSLLNLIAQIGMLAALFVGYYFAKRKKFRNHANVQTAVVLINLFFIFFIMLTTAVSALGPGSDPASHPNPFIILHIILGVVAEVLAIYLIIRMRTKWLPESLRVKNFKLLMQITLGLWTAAVLFGLVIYGAYYYGLGS
jgi:uncharacterized membrane protein YozB (DUF420 family)